MIEALIRLHLEGSKASRILDVGPGYAAFSRVSAAVVGATNITFVDTNPDVLSWQAAECRNAGIEAECQRLSLESGGLSQLTGTYGIIHCQEVLEHLLQPEELLNVLARLLAEDGRIVITVPTRRSERWIRFVNPLYMKNEAYGHIQEFDPERLRLLLHGAGLEALVLVPTQPHYFVTHTWLFGTRMKVEGSTGKVLTGGWRAYVLNGLLAFSRKAFVFTGARLWGRLLPRNYFVVARKARDGHPS